MELEIPKNALRKRTSTSAIRESEESRKRACGTTEEMAQGKTGAGVGQGAEVPAEGKVDHPKVDKEPKEERKRVERKPH